MPLKPTQQLLHRSPELLADAARRPPPGPSRVLPKRGPRALSGRGGTSLPAELALHSPLAASLPPKATGKANINVFHPNQIGTISLEAFP